MIYEAFGWDAPVFGHMSLIINSETGKKLSKRDESVLQFIEQYRSLGYLPEAMLNFIILLGWSPVGESEIFSLREFVKMYDEKRLSKSPAAFDAKKLEWINNQYVKAADEDRIMHSSLLQLIKADKIAKNPSAEKVEWARKLVNLFKRQMSYTAQIVEFTELFFHGPDEIDEDSQKELAADNALPALKSLEKKFEELELFDTVNILAAIKAVQKETGIKGRALWMPIRIAITHEMHGPELPESLELLGYDLSMKHLKAMIAELEAK